MENWFYKSVSNVGLVPVSRYAVARWSQVQSGMLTSGAGKGDTWGDLAEVPESMEGGGALMIPFRPSGQWRLWRRWEVGRQALSKGKDTLKKWA